MCKHWNRCGAHIIRGHQEGDPKESNWENSFCNGQPDQCIHFKYRAGQLVLPGYRDPCDLKISNEKPIVIEASASYDWLKEMHLVPATP